MRGGGLAVFLTLLLASCAPPILHNGPARPVSADGSIRIEARPLPLNASEPKQDRAGEFVFAGAVQLTSPDTALLGGLSDLKVAEDGTLTAVSDEGSLLRAHVVLDNDGRLIGLDRSRLSLLLGLDGKPLPNKAAADAEGLAVWPNGDVMISFEHDHRIWVYPADHGRPTLAPRPQVPMPENDGMEGLALAPSQGADAYWVGLEAGPVWLCRLAADCRPAAGQFPPPSTYRLTSVFEMQNGDLTVVHHHWDPMGGTHVILSVIGNPASDPRPALKARFRLDPPLTVDNIEGVAVVERAGGVHRFYLISDNNFASSQKTLLMAFDWKSGGGAP